MTSQTHIIDAARTCAHLFRLGRDIEAALKMVDLIDAAMPLAASEQKAQWTQVLSALLQCQERQDWIGAADWLEVEFVNLCHR